MRQLLEANSITDLSRRGPIMMAVFVVLMAGLLCFLPGQSSIAPMDRDEARFAQSSKQMVTTGDYITPRFQQDLRAKKPVGIYWMQSAAASLFGVDDIASYRLPSLIGGLLAIAAVTILASFFMPPFQAILSGLLLACSLVMVVESHLANTDAMLTALVIIKQGIFWRILNIARTGAYVSGKYAVMFWGVMALAILVKGPIAPLIALLTGLTIFAFERRFYIFKPLRPILGLVILTSLVLPWVLMVTSATDGAFLNIAIKGDLVNKLQTGQESHGAPPLTYLMLVVITFWPGSLFIARGITAIRNQWRDPNILFCLGWIVPFWVVLELTPTKLPHYNLPVFAALAILCSIGAFANLPPAKSKPAEPQKPQNNENKEKTKPSTSAFLTKALAYTRTISLPRSLVLAWEYLFMAIGPVLGVVVLYAASFAQGSRAMAGVALLASIIVSIGAFWWQRGGSMRAIGVMITAAIGFPIALMGGVMPSLDKIRVSPRLHAEIATLDPAPEVIIAAGYHEPSLVFIQGTDTLLFPPVDAALALAEADGGLALVESRAQNDFLKTAEAIGLKLETVATIKGHNISRGQNISIDLYRPNRDVQPKTPQNNTNN